MTRARDIADGLGAESGEVVPHIKLDVLYPAVAGKDLSGTALGGSYVYGNAHTDGRKYYYTDIKGSKPIKDPRIGAFFGSQRHMFKSLQLLEQETATQGKNVYSIDGREWIRAYTTSTKNFVMENGSHGEVLLGTDDCAGVTLEIVGYFNNFNMISRTAANQCDDIGVTVNGGTERDSADTGKLFGDSTVASPLGSRYVSSGSVINHGDSNLTTDLGTTPKINTLKITAKTGSSEYIYTYGIELIAQDTTSTANKSKIQIPAQTVVSYGKKHSITATAEHYDPFNGFVDDTTLFSAKVDTATSLGLGTATTWGCAWDKGSSNHIRPLNGGRVVKWIDSSGNIKTSVTMMPRNAQNIGNNTTNGSAGTASNEITTASATNAHAINFSDDVIDNSLSEIAKTFHYREFGNGSANGGTGASYADASMVSGTADDLSFVMADGLTSLSANDCNDTTANFDCLRWANADNDDVWYLTFIGTGISWEGTANMTSNDRRNHIYAQNLPYGTHVVKVIRTGSAAGNIIIDGITVDQPASGADDSKLGVGWITIYQPKIPPVPQDAVIIADYMLMADAIMLTSLSTEGQISKGVRRCHGAVDTFVDSPSGGALAGGVFYGNNNVIPFVPAGSSPDATDNLGHFTQNSFSTRCQIFSQSTNVSANALYVNGSSDGSATNIDNSGQAYQDAFLSTVQTLGINKYEQRKPHGGYSVSGFDHVTPIHTSSHYQTFETPYLHELVGGDRNMEQTNLVVSPSGETWDEVTRDTSYIGKMILQMTTDTHTATENDKVIFDEWRGMALYSGNPTRPCFNKDFAIAYDRMICLRDGQYMCYAHSHSNSVNEYLSWFLNGVLANQGYTNINDTSMSTSVILDINRGDYLHLQGAYGEHWVIGHSSYVIRL